MWDSSIISSTLLRRDLVRGFFVSKIRVLISQARVISDVKETCDTKRLVTASMLQEMVDGFFNAWYGKWSFALCGNNRE